MYEKEKWDPEVLMIFLMWKWTGSCIAEGNSWKIDIRARSITNEMVTNMVCG